MLTISFVGFSFNQLNCVYSCIINKSDRIGV